MAVWSRVATMCRRITTTITVVRRRRRITMVRGRIIGKRIENPLRAGFFMGIRQQKSLPFPAG
ncbi:hypothetical protein [Paraburkholderia fungorum]|uniref:hypothetical protein n=1 Tax=Paraburkholderia fungorum TaxID=134537 RepID=UPI00115F9325|nr:hypothetical protein [Paraburkholderia fungorum]